MGERQIEVTGLGLGAASERFVQVAMAHGYTVVASGPNRFRMARTYRPKWALITAVATAAFVGLGLLFLLVKRTETGDVVVVEDRSGVKLRLTGAIQQPVVDALRQLLGTPLSAAAPVAAAATSFQGPAAAPASAYQPAAMPVPTAPVPAYQPLAYQPSAQPVVQQPVVQQPVVQPVLVLADGRAIGVGAGGVLGRDPAADPLLPGGQLHAISDPSLSKTHLSFGPLPNGVWVLDHHSTNGTVVSANGMSTPCTPGARVEAPFGSQVLAGDVSIEVGAR